MVPTKDYLFKKPSSQRDAVMRFHPKGARASTDSKAAAAAVSAAAAIRAVTGMQYLLIDFLSLCVF